ncbi:fused response regulator/phosphatase [Planctomicrobium sp.]|nr:fused response regulator/phosphatase [Planctomicrobium sp.]MDB4439950.1 fused response regulator/phosphatase [Planctomicrobium sp.]MDB4733506.1 fused response regulator/phosphatase [Planctomicrobium sp.]MDB4743059.1 fused response regulator/phosphatase [Planctomicrobium sp.]
MRSDNSKTLYRVLLVEDNELDIEIVLRCFRHDQLAQVSGAIEISVANCLKEAFELISKSNFQAILLDLGLPDGTGIEILHKVRKFSSNIPIIILTGNEDDTLGVEALRSGADDFLKKSSISEDTLPRSVRYSIERNFRLLAEAQLHRTQAEIIAAETIQQKLLPDFSPEVVDYDIYGACHPAEKIGGDLFDYLSFDDTSCVGVVADVSGHGLPAAILMTELHGLLHGLIEQNVSLPRLMSAANIRTDKATESYQFITMISYHLSAENHSFSYIYAGHPAWILKGDGTEVVLKSQYLPLGVDTKKKRLSLTQVRVESGDILVLPTDGVFEALGINGERFSVERMLKEIRNNKGLSAKEIVHHVLDCAKEFSLDHRLTDDCTLVVIKAC